MEYIVSIDNDLQRRYLETIMARLISSQARLPYPFAEYIEDKIWALRSYKGNHRMYYCLDEGRIILLDGYQKKSMKIDRRVLRRVGSYYIEFYNTKNIIEYLPAT